MLVQTSSGVTDRQNVSPNIIRGLTTDIMLVPSSSGGYGLTHTHTHTHTLGIILLDWEFSTLKTLNSSFAAKTFWSCLHKFYLYRSQAFDHFSHESLTTHATLTNQIDTTY